MQGISLCTVGLAKLFSNPEKKQVKMNIQMARDRLVMKQLQSRWQQLHLCMSQYGERSKVKGQRTGQDIGVPVC